MRWSIIWSSTTATVAVYATGTGGGDTGLAGRGVERGTGDVARDSFCIGVCSGDDGVDIGVDSGDMARRTTW
jgi:hypothetical protein